MSVSLVKKSLELVSAEKPSTERSEKSTKLQSSSKIIKKKKSDPKKSAVAYVEKVRQTSGKEVEKDKVEANVRKLLNLTKAESIHKKLENKLLDKVIKTKKECLEKKQQSVFTEEDFAKFEKEYFINGCY